MVPLLLLHSKALIFKEANRKFLTVCGIPKILSNLLKYPSESVLIEVCKPLRNMLMECM